MAERLTTLVGSSASLVEVEKCLSIQSPEDILAAQQIALGPDGCALLRAGKEQRPGVWVGRNARVHPDAKLVAPIYIGENTRVEAGAEVGPYSVICADCIVDSGTSVQNSTVFQESYVGQSLEVVDSLVERNHLVNTRLGVTVPMADEFILGSMRNSDKEANRVGWLTRLGAAILLVIFSPAMLLTSLVLKLRRNGPVWSATEVVRLPAPSDPSRWITFKLWSLYPRELSRLSDITYQNPTHAGWRHFMLGFLPALFSVVKGDLKIVGVPPRTREELELLPLDWRESCLSAPVGIVSESLLSLASGGPDQAYAADLYYSYAQSAKTDFRLLKTYFTWFSKPLTGSD
jgi:lipopolysaccharide/colanic/teichoic acid biosynthesis glycosyltransferase